MIPDYLYITPYYKDPAQNKLDKLQLEQDAWGAYDSKDPVKTEGIILDWALHCSGCVNEEARLVLTYKGNLFLEAAMRLDDWNSGVFTPWVQTVYRPAAYSFYFDDNNHASWGILGCVLSDMILGHSLEVHKSRLEQHMKDSWDKTGLMKKEILRTNSGVWYSYFSLAPMLRACQLLNVPFIDEMVWPLTWLFKYCVDPDSWPYKLPPGFIGRLIRFFFPCTDEYQKAQPDNWPGNLYLEAGRQFGVADWEKWAKPPFLGVNVFRCS